MTVNEKNTISNVKSFLTGDFWHYIQLGGIRPTTLKSANFDAIATNTSNVNGLEENVINTLDKADRAQYIAITILLALYDCSDFEYQKRKTILYSLYIQQLTQEQTAIKLSFSNYKLRQQLNQGCIEFAERLNYWRIKRNVSELPDLLEEN
ncbi:hypothetical protein FC52_GL001282 [Lactobacillus pasteurii DSM 23907 = CRBIP 24.76]|uniref:Phage transcriptional regulator, ArpU family n=1 Tax=Lactobacillus pasteurii DSM 23907 = CRBIP 24.76 TaxID=1423790 RepID=I7JYE6_9LACO|nr:hypothetical protein [Lactobacillus pasteurii]KRK07162.1 hypothetical protein FC52_GL001282 [Lactobacillus pasteurii DSM 23907 = CRBIP 24.76]TDG76433.1 hypothetical protein C5L33_001192 [Lactobacillus pasteurii]CCI85475.1 Putative uncharacterized protein orf27 [Lactobacillus pasteurii DSM 23907 = CRBIP 24.76]CCI85843.1 Putative uncharacterized protein orf27 [Lactobacillus pasteurii DSM 23907 = CRBIP 24.76]